MSEETRLANASVHYSGVSTGHTRSRPCTHASSFGIRTTRAATGLSAAAVHHMPGPTLSCVSGAPRCLHAFSRPYGAQITAARNYRQGPHGTDGMPRGAGCHARLLQTNARRAAW